MNASDIETLLEPFGLKLRGIALLSAKEITDYELGESDEDISVALVGNIGSSFWAEFIDTEEYGDGDPDPLDRWSRRVADEIAPKLDATPVFPFQGPTYLPFQQWAGRAESLHQSPLGLMIHPQYGLWHAYRFALLIPAKFELPLNQQDSPCLSCEQQPCLNTCPVKAFSGTGYDVDRCVDYLKQNRTADCFEHGCMARFNCPAGRELRYVDQQSQFHLQAFIRGQ